MKILAIDPGYSTGIVDTEDDRIINSFLRIDTSEVMDLVHQKASQEDYAIVIEDFVGAGPRTKEAIFVLKLIGAVEGICFVNGAYLVVQTPNTRIPFVPDAKRKAPKGTIIHIIDAYAHALAYWEREHAESK